MSEDFLEKALQEMKEENVDARTLEAVRGARLEDGETPAVPPVRSSGRTSMRIWFMSCAAAAACSWKIISAAAPAVAPGSPN